MTPATTKNTAKTILLHFFIFGFVLVSELTKYQPVAESAKPEKEILLNNLFLNRLFCKNSFKTKSNQKMKNIFKLSTFLLLTSAFLFSCTPRVGITGSWKNPDKTEPTTTYNNIFLTTLMSDELTSRNIQDHLAKELSIESVKSSKSYYVFPDMYKKDSKSTKEEVFAKVNEGKSDAILIVSAFDVETEEQYIPNTSTVYTPSLSYANAGNFWGFYTYYRPRVYRDGYVSKDKVYYVEVNLFDVEDDKLIWSIQTKTYNPTDLNNYSDELAQTVVRAMKKDGIIE